MTKRVDLRLHFLGIIAALLFLFSIVFVSACKDKNSESDASTQFVAHYTPLDSLAWVYVNEYRDSVGLGALARNDALWVEAHIHSTDMKNGRVPLGHDGFYERAEYLKPWLADLGTGHFGENVAYLQIVNLEKLTDYWRTSPGHKQNLEGSYHYVGISCVPDSNNVYCYVTMMLYE